MLKIPPIIESSYKTILEKNRVPLKSKPYYLKWLRYFLDFCEKYKFDSKSSDSLRPFIQKLSQRKQTEKQQQEARHAVRFFHQLVQQPENSQTGLKENNIAVANAASTHVAAKKTPPLEAVNSPAEKYALPSEGSWLSISEGSELKLIGADWRQIYDELETAVKVRHYSPRTLKAYRSWTRQFQTFLKSKDQRLISVDDVKAFLSFLAVKREVSASSQNQAFNALLFLFRHVLGKEFGKVEGVVRAKRKAYIPVVLSREEIDTIVGFLQYPYDLIAKLLYGCGLRLSECLGLRVSNFNFDAGILTIHDGKGQKDRTVPLPVSLVPELKKHLESVINQHQQDLESGYNGVFLYGQLAKKYKSAAKELVWQWFFPAKTLTLVPDRREYRRYHIHESRFQKQMRRAVKKSKIPKRASAHTLRHSFASHLLQANYDIRTIQELLGHSDVRTTMIYTHTIKSQTLKEAKSPLDFGYAAGS